MNSWQMISASGIFIPGLVSIELVLFLVPLNRVERLSLLKARNAPKFDVGSVSDLGGNQEITDHDRVEHCRRRGGWFHEMAIPRLESAGLTFHRGQKTESDPVKSQAERHGEERSEGHSKARNGWKEEKKLFAFRRTVFRRDASRKRRSCHCGTGLAQRQRKTSNSSKESLD